MLESKAFVCNNSNSACTLKMLVTRGNLVTVPLFNVFFVQPLSGNNWYQCILPFKLWQPTGMQEYIIHLKDIGSHNTEKSTGKQKVCQLYSWTLLSQTSFIQTSIIGISFFRTHLSGSIFCEYSYLICEICHNFFTSNKANVMLFY